MRQIVLKDAPAMPSLRSLTSYKIPFLSDLPVVGRGLFSQSPLFYFAVVMALAIAFVLGRTRAGLLLRAAGRRRAGARCSRLPGYRGRFSAMLFTGFMADLVGPIWRSSPPAAPSSTTWPAGRGYLALAIVIFGRWKPLPALLAALLFGAADALQYQGRPSASSQHPRCC